MKTLSKRMIASFILSSVLASVASAAVKLPVPGQDETVARACYNAAGTIVPCKRLKPLQ
jgi:hypothetical protein